MGQRRVALVKRCSVKIYDCPFDMTRWPERWSYYICRVCTCTSFTESLAIMCYIQEAVSDTLEQLWISYNNIEKLKGITVLTKLKVSTMDILDSVDIR